MQVMKQATPPKEARPITAKATVSDRGSVTVKVADALKDKYVQTQLEAVKRIREASPLQALKR